MSAKEPADSGVVGLQFFSRSLQTHNVANTFLMLTWLQFLKGCFSKRFELELALGNAWNDTNSTTTFTLLSMAQRNEEILEVIWSDLRLHGLTIYEIIIWNNWIFSVFAPLGQWVYIFYAPTRTCFFYIVTC